MSGFELPAPLADELHAALGAPPWWVVDGGADPCGSCSKQYRYQQHRHGCQSHDCTTSCSQHVWTVRERMQRVRRDPWGWVASRLHDGAVRVGYDCETDR